MALTIEWRQRIERWMSECEKQIYLPLGSIDLEGFVTREHLTPAQARNGTFPSMPAGTRWGMKWEYGWFRGTVVLPATAGGKWLVLRTSPAHEGIVFVNGTASGAHDYHHHSITLSRNARPGERFDILTESYAGHGPRLVSTGPVPPGIETIPEVTAPQETVAPTTFGIWEEDAYQCLMDLRTLWEIREKIDPDSLRTAQIDDALRRFTLSVDFEAPHDRVMESLRAGRGLLAPMLQCVNGTTAPVMYCFGHAHLDTAWLWPLQETHRKIARTLGNQLALVEQYPDYRFLCSQPYQYRTLREQYPELYARVKEAVSRGRIIPEGSMWVEADTNVPSGESLIRQILHGKRFFREEFGVDNRLLWLPDVFGYSGALPQILKGCGVDYFSTSKIFWNYNGGEPFPFNTFLWEGIDGTRILSHLYTDYNATTNPASVIAKWKERPQKDGLWGRLFPFGWGDGGGGPTRDHLEYLDRERDLEGVPRMLPASPLDYFGEVERRGIPDAVYVGELYFQAHRGTYTSQARTKKGNRKSEFALREAELWGALAHSVAEFPYPRQEIDEAWKTVLLHQFHDILPGSSIQRVYEEAEAAFASVISHAGQMAGAARSALVSSAPDGIVVFNSLGFPRRSVVEVPSSFQGAVSAAGEVFPTQVIEDKTYAPVTVPSCGMTTLKPARPGSKAVKVSATQQGMENDLLRIAFDDRGEITGIFDKTEGRELTAGPCNRFCMYKDITSNWDAWDIESQYSFLPVDLPGKAEITVIAQGPLLAVVRVRRTLHDSDLVQDIVLRHNNRRIDFRTVIEWRERHKLLKVNFPVSVYAQEAVHEIQFGHLRRPTHRSRQYDADRFEVSAHKWSALVEAERGCAVLNDCKYGVNVEGNSINLTLLKSSLVPDQNADQGRQEFTYAFYSWTGPFSRSGIVEQAYDLNVPPVIVAGSAEERSFISVDAPNIVIDTIKAAEDGSGDLILRLYESMRTATRCTVTVGFPISSAFETTMLEEKVRDLELRKNEVIVDFRAFEVKTVRVVG